MDIIYIRDLRAECIIGAWDWERRIRQRINIDLDLGCDIAAAGKSDALADTLSYKDVAKRVLATAQDSQYNLVEKLAEEIAAVLLAEFAVEWCRVRVNKFGAVRGAGDVGVIIERAAKAKAKAAGKAKKKSAARK